MLLAQRSDAEIDELYADSQPETLTPNSITTVAELKRALEGVRQAGLAFDREESTPDVACVSAPVHDHTGEVVAAMSISVPLIRWDERGDDGWSATVRAGAQRLSRQLGKQD